MDNSSLMAWSGLVVTIVTGVATLQKVLRNIKKSREERNALILQEAKEEISAAKQNLEARLMALENDLDSLKEDIDRDLGHLKETHSNELDNVSEKILMVRQELRDQHSQILQLLTALIENK